MRFCFYNQFVVKSKKLNIAKENPPFQNLKSIENNFYFSPSFDAEVSSYTFLQDLVVKLVRYFVLIKDEERFWI